LKGCQTDKIFHYGAVGNAGQNHDIKIANKSFENMAQFIYLRTVTNQNLIQEKIRAA
jgi:hypothetical protein